MPCQGDAVALGFSAEGTEAFAPPLAFILADAFVIGFLVEGLLGLNGGIDILEE